MNRLGHYALDHAAYGFDHFAIGVLHVGEIRRNGSFRMLLPNRTSLHVHGFFQGIFQFIVVIGFIRINLTPFWEIQLKGLEYTHITVRPWPQGACDRLTVFGDQEMDFEPINIALLAGNVSPIGFMLVYLSPWNPVMVTHSDGKAIKERDGCRMKMFPGLSSQVKQGQQEMVETMSPPVQATPAAQVWHRPRCAQQGPRRFKVAPKEAHGHEGCGDDFRIAHLLLRLFRMAERLSEVGTQTIDGEDLLVHGRLLCWGRGVATPYPGGGIPWMSRGRNLG
jgi:hypothetical protein